MALCPIIPFFSISPDCVRCETRPEQRSCGRAHENSAIGETFGDGLAYIAVQYRKLLGVAGDTLEKLVNFCQELWAEARALLLIPVACLVEFEARLFTEKYLAHQRCQRAWASALMVSQAAVSSGVDSSSARRRSSSAISARDGGSRPASMATESQMSLTSVMRSSTLMLSMPNACNACPMSASFAAYATTASSTDKSAPAPLSG